MTNNISVNPGTVTPVATDEVSGVHYQRIKLVDGTEDSTVGVKATPSGALNVQDMGVNTAVSCYALLLSTAIVAVQTGGANLANRVFIHLQNDSDVAIEIHNNPTFTPGTGTLIPSGMTAGFSWGPGITVYAAAASGSGKRLRVIEMA